MILPILLIILGIVILAALVLVVLSRVKKGGGGPKRERNRDAVLKDAAKRLNQNPRDPAALASVGNIYFLEEAWENVYKNYEQLVAMPATTPGFNVFEANFRYGLSALKLGRLNEAYRGFSTAWGIKPDNFEINYNLGTLEFQRKNYEKAINLLQQARRSNPEHAPTLRQLGHSFFKIKKYKEAMAFIRQAIELAPEDKESLYTLGECYYEANQSGEALKIFSHLRADPAVGANACLISGIINTDQHQYPKAIEDFEIGVKHINAKPEIMADIKYRLAKVYLQQNEIGKAMACLKDIEGTNPNYKDAAALISKYQELNANRNLQIYLMASQADFIALCRKVIISFFPKARVKITNITVHNNEWADILSEVDTPKWSDVVMFRFIRSQGSVGEFIVRDFHSHLKEVKAGKGICISTGSFSDEAKRYTEARLIDLIEKERFTAMLNVIDGGSPAPAGGTTVPAGGV